MIKRERKKRGGTWEKHVKHRAFHHMHGMFVNMNVDMNDSCLTTSISQTPI